MTTATPLATGTYRDIWAGDVPVIVVPFRTKRRGETVTRYHWQRADRNEVVGGFASPFVTVEAALRATTRHRFFSNVQGA